MPSGVFLMETPILDSCMDKTFPKRKAISVFGIMCVHEYSSLRLLTMLTSYLVLLTGRFSHENAGLLETLHRFL